METNLWCINIAAGKHLELTLAILETDYLYSTNKHLPKGLCNNYLEA